MNSTKLRFSSKSRAFVGVFITISEQLRVNTVVLPVTLYTNIDVVICVDVLTFILRCSIL